MLVRLAAELDLARLSLHGEVLVERRAPAVTSAGLRLVPPAGGFLQATEAGEAVLAGAVVAALDRKTKRVVDLFSGAGPFTLAMAQTRDVHAVEGEAAALASLDRAVRAVPGLRRVTTERRDLFRRPLLPIELEAYDAVVFDPAAGGGGGPGGPDRRIEGAAGHRRGLRCRHVLPRCRRPRRRRLHIGAGHPHRSVRAFRPCRGGRRVPTSPPGAQAPVARKLDKAAPAPNSHRMRTLILALGLVALTAPARADACGDLIERVVASTEARVVKRTADFAEFTAAEGIGLTLACGELSSVGVQFRGPSLPAGYFPLFGRAGHATTGISASEIEAAAVKARENAVTTRHSHVDAGTALVTCSVSNYGGGLVTACAVIDKADRS